MDEHIPLIVEPQVWQQTAHRMRSVLVKHGFSLRRRNPSWVMKAPWAIMVALGGGSFRHFVPQQIEL